MSTPLLSALTLWAAPFFLVTTLVAAQEAPITGPAAPKASGKPHLTAEPSHVEFGDAFQGELLNQEVVVRNSGTGNFPLATIQTSCGCTAARIIGPDGTEYPTRGPGNEPILVLHPDEEMKVMVEFNTAGKSGDVSQSMKLHPADPSLEPLEVDVHIRVTKALQVTPAWLNLNKIPKTGPLEEIVLVESVEIGDWDITGFKNQTEGIPLPDWMQFEVLDQEGSRRRVRVSLGNDRPVGAISTRVAIQIDHERIKQVDFAVSAIVEPNVSFNTESSSFQDSVNFEHVNADDKVTRTIKVLNKDPSVPYMLEGVDILTSQKDFFETEIRTLDEGVSYEIDITVDGAIGAPFFRGSLVLRAEHPDLPSKMIPFHGWVQK
ncbi:MAG: DUF1573 domain-containing protein [Planctomycetota bacterium]|nr:DUF1573 domain-containing protein [Planctomycetota bacterium]